MCAPTLSPRGWWSWQLQTPSWKTTPRNSHWRWQTHRRLLPREIMHTSEPARRAGTRRVPMKSLPAGPGLENANLDSGKVRRVALQQRRGAAYPQRKYTRAPTPSSMMFLEIMERTCEQESKASALQTQTRGHRSKCILHKRRKYGLARKRATASML